MWQAVCLGNITREVQWSLGKKHFASPHTPRALFTHIISVSDALSHFLATAKHIFLVMMTRLFLRGTIHAQSFCSISWYLVFLPNPWLKLRKTEAFCMIQGTVECLGCKKSEVHSNAPIIPPWPASKRTGEAQSPTFCLNLQNGK